MKIFKNIKCIKNEKKTLILISKNVEYAVEKNCISLWDKNFFLMDTSDTEDHYASKLKNCFNSSKFYSSLNYVSQNHATYQAINDFSYIRNCPFTLFFRISGVDVPRFFYKTKSVKRFNNKVDYLKFNNYLMRGGDRSKSFRFLNKAFNHFFIDYMNLFILQNAKTFSWKDIFLSLNFFSLNKKKYKIFSNFKNEPTTFNNKITLEGKSITTECDLSLIFFNNISKLTPVFSFYIYKVDKKIYKNSRGRSGKFTFIWKYVSPYKRLFLVMHWLVKELRSSPGRSLNDRIVQLLKTVILTPEKTSAFKIRKFSHNYVYMNCRKTLAETYVTSTK